MLFYGSALRDGALDGVLDFYVLHRSAGAWPGSRLAALANRVLPPNVGYVEEDIDGRTLRAKYAVMTLAQFRRAMAAERIDTTLWARFSQPCACVCARAAKPSARGARGGRRGRGRRRRAGRRALGPERGEPTDYWRALYARTYAVELRVERGARGRRPGGARPATATRVCCREAWHAGGHRLRPSATTAC